jgi:hypothetical protein
MDEAGERVARKSLAAWVVDPSKSRRGLWNRSPLRHLSLIVYRHCSAL